MDRDTPLIASLGSVNRSPPRKGNTVPGRLELKERNKASTPMSRNGSNEASFHTPPPVRKFPINENFNPVPNSPPRGAQALTRKSPPRPERGDKLLGMGGASKSPPKVKKN